MYAHATCRCGCSILAQPSQLVGVSLPRPMGLILEEDQRLRRVVVAGFVEGSVAEQRSKVNTTPL